MAWKPVTYIPAVDPEEDTLEKRQRDTCPFPEFRCPSCGSWRRAELLVDVRSLQIDTDYACDGCWTDWERRAISVNGERKPTSRREWKENWLTALGAPKETVDKAKAVREPDPYGDVKASDTRRVPKPKPIRGG